MYVHGSCWYHDSQYLLPALEFPSEGWTTLDRPQRVSLQPGSQYQPQNPLSSNNRCVDKSCRSSDGDGRRRVGSRSHSGGSASLRDLSDCLWFPPEKAKALCWLACVNSNRSLCLRKRLGTTCHTTPTHMLAPLVAKVRVVWINSLATNSSRNILTCDRGRRICLWPSNVRKQKVPNTV